MRSAAIFATLAVVTVTARTPPHGLGNEQRLIHANHPVAECNMPVNKGLRSCFGSFPRWYFNINYLRCEPFIFTGCGGNANRFSSEWECENMCDPIAVRRRSGCDLVMCAPGQHCVMHDTKAVCVNGWGTA